jgi:hypothetical protein
VTFSIKAAIDLDENFQKFRPKNRNFDPFVLPSPVIASPVSDGTFVVHRETVAISKSEKQAPQGRHTGSA